MEFNVTFTELDASFTPEMDTYVGEPPEYLKDAEVNGATLTITKKDDTTVEFTKPTKTSDLTNDSDFTTTEYVNDTFQEKLDNQTSYTSKGSATKVPVMTTNTLGQVTNITEVDIDAGKVDDVTVNGTSVVQNKVAQVTVPTKTSDLQNDKNFVTAYRNASGALVISY